MIQSAAFGFLELFRLESNRHLKVIDQYLRIKERILTLQFQSTLIPLSGI